MEWIEGTKLPWGEDSERLIGLGLECSIYQLLEEGFLHAGEGKKQGRAYLSSLSFFTYANHLPT